MSAREKMVLFEGERPLIVDRGDRGVGNLTPSAVGHPQTTARGPSPNGLQTQMPSSLDRPISNSFRPNYKSLHLAAQHRINSALKRTRPGNTSGVRLARRQRRCKSAITTGSSASDEYASKSQTDSDFCVLELDGKFDDSAFEEALMEEEPSFIQRRLREENHSQKTYRAACRSIKVPCAASFVKGLKNTSIVMRNHVIGPNGARACAIALVDNGTVEALDLEGNAICQQGAQYICDMLRENIFITELSLSDNCLGSGGLALVTELMKHNEIIHKLNLSGNTLDESDADYIAEILMENVTLQELRLSHNRFREKGGRIIGNALMDNTALEILDLSWNNLRRRGAAGIAEGIQKNIGVRKLDVSWNGFHMDGCKALGKALEVNNTLEELDLTCNRVTAASLTELLKGLRKNECLTNIKLAQNPLSSDGAAALLAAVLTAPSSAIKFIDISGQDVGREFLLHLEEFRRQDRHLLIRYGLTLRQESIWEIKEDDLMMTENPMTILMEYMRLSNLRLIDLFSWLDKDKSMSISRDEFKCGLLKANVPIPESGLDRLMARLDRDGDGQVDFAELLVGQKEHKAKLYKYMQDAKRYKIPFEDTELGRVNDKLKLTMRAKYKQGYLKGSKKVVIGSGFKKVVEGTGLVQHVDKTDQVIRRSMSRDSTMLSDTVDFVKAHSRILSSDGGSPNPAILASNG